MEEYAIIKTGGKQYRVSKGDVIEVELLEGDVGAQIEFNDILVISQGSQREMGKPSVSGFFVRGEIVGASSGPKIVSMKYKPRGHGSRKFGHRQHYSLIKITEIGKQEKEQRHGT